jgi:hypothetical protein
VVGHFLIQSARRFVIALVVCGFSPITRVREAGKQVQQRIQTAVIVRAAGAVVNGNCGLSTNEGQDDDAADNAYERLFQHGFGPVPLSFNDRMPA